MPSENESPADDTTIEDTPDSEQLRDTVNRLRDEAPEQAERLRARAGESAERASAAIKEGMEGAHASAEKARELSGEGAHQAAARLRGLAGDREGMVGRAASKAADTLDRAGSYVEPKRSRMSLSPLAMMKQYPLEALVLAGAVAFVVIRAMRR